MNHFLLMVGGRMMPSVRGLAFVGVFAVLMFGTQAMLQAAPVTFAFDAEITTVSRGIPFDSGVDFAVGDTISGQFTLDPLEDCAVFDGPVQPLGDLCATTQSSSFTVDINGAILRTPGFDLDVRNDTLILDSSLATDIDSIESRGGNLSPLDPISFPNIDPATSSFNMSLWAFAHRLSITSVPGSVETWNQFRLKRVISIHLRDGLGNVMGFQAAVGDFSVIPEPSTLCLVILISLGIFPQRCFSSSRRREKRCQVPFLGDR